MIMSTRISHLLFLPEQVEHLLVYPVLAPPVDHMEHFLRATTDDEISPLILVAPIWRPESAQLRPKLEGGNDKFKTSKYLRVTPRFFIPPPTVRREGRGVGTAIGVKVEHNDTFVVHKERRMDVVNNSKNVDDIGAEALDENDVVMS